MPTLAVLMVAGFQVPETGGLLADCAGRSGGVLFWQSGPTGLKTGLISLVISISIVAVTAHCPGSGVKV
jgi:hypothetical protein